MKAIILIFSVMFSLSFFGQSEIITKDAELGRSYFAQCKFDADQTTFLEFEKKLKSNSQIKMARFEWSTKRVFIMTKELNSFSELEFSELFNESKILMKCIQTGVHGRDTVQDYGNCKN